MLDLEIRPFYGPTNFLSHSSPHDLTNYYNDGFSCQESASALSNGFETPSRVSGQSLPYTADTNSMQTPLESVCISSVK